MCDVNEPKADRNENYELSEPYTVKNKKLRANDHGLWNPFSSIHALMTMLLTKRACSSRQKDMLNHKHMPMGFKEDFPLSR
jgi:hypothetical protein